MTSFAGFGGLHSISKIRLLPQDGVLAGYVTQRRQLNPPAPGQPVAASLPPLQPPRPEGAGGSGGPDGGPQLTMTVWKSCRPNSPDELKACAANVYVLSGGAALPGQVKVYVIVPAAALAVPVVTVCCVCAGSLTVKTAPVALSWKVAVYVRSRVHCKPQLIEQPLPPAFRVHCALAAPGEPHGSSPVGPEMLPTGAGPRPPLGLMISPVCVTENCCEVAALLVAHALQLAFDQDAVTATRR